MQRIDILTGIGKGKNCLIIGGGLSVLEFDFKKLPDNFIRICVNNAIPKHIQVRIDYLIYNDANFLRLLKELKLPDGIKVITSSESPHPIAEYCYWNNDIGCKDNDNTGLRALSIAKNIFQFDNIYLIGFDFHTQVINGKEQSHFYGDEYGEHKKYPERMQVEDHYIALPKFIEQFDKFKNRENIYNCYKESSLKIFPYKLIKE